MIQSPDFQFTEDFLPCTLAERLQRLSNVKEEEHQTLLGAGCTTHAKVVYLTFILLLAGCWVSAQERRVSREESTCEGGTCEVERNGVGAEGREAGRTIVEDSKSPQFRRQQGARRDARQFSRGWTDSFDFSFETSEENEFQRFVYSSTGLHLPLYGQSLFQNRMGSFASSSNVPVPPDYVVGIGDDLIIRITGQVNIKASATVDRNGQIFVPRVGAVSVAGVRFKELQPLLSKQVSRFFRNFDLSINLARLRGLHIYVVGMARRPGTYTVSALSTLINSVFASGGPGPNGSMRRVELRRAGQTMTELDLYDFVGKGDGSRDVPLIDGDVIYFPAIGPLVALTGSVRQPAIYELREPTSVEDLLAFAGGLTATADGQRAVLERIEDNRVRHIEQFDLDGTGLAKQLRNGDLLRVFSISPRFNNAITLRGNVTRPGRYPWREGMHISDLLQSPETIISMRYWRNRSWLGSDQGGWLAGQGGRSETRAKLLASKLGGSSGSSRVGIKERQGTINAGASDHKTGQPRRSRTAFKRTPAEINWDYAVIERLNKTDLSTQLLPFNLGRAILHPESNDNLVLEPDDVVTVFSQRDVAVPVEKRTKFVLIEGEVKAAGVYRVGPGEGLREVVARAGGLTPQAYLFATEFRRESTRIEQQDNLQRMLDQMEKDLRAKFSRLAASATVEDRRVSNEELASERAAIARLRQTHPTGRIVLGLNPTDHDASLLPALALEDGDRIIVPARSATVAVAGAVYNQNSFLHRSGSSLKDYLRQSGGATREADKARLFVIRADGSVISKQMQHSFWGGSLESLKLMPGDTIVMPEKIRTGSLLRGLRDWSQVFSQFALGAAAIKVISP